MGLPQGWLLYEFWLGSGKASRGVSGALGRRSFRGVKDGTVEGV